MSELDQVKEKKTKQMLNIITEGGLRVGFGHLTRTISLAQAFKNMNYEIRFVVNGDNSVYKILDNYDTTILNWNIYKKNLLSQVRNSNLILIDSIKITDLLLKEIEKLNIPIIFFDDEKRRNILDSGFVIDWTVLSDKKDYFIPRKDNVTYLLGSKYTILRKEFTRSRRNKINAKVESVMISFGGSDVRNITPKILEFLKNNYPSLEKKVVIGPGFQNINEIEKTADRKTKLLYYPDANEMTKCMQNSDIAISAGGQTLYELAMIGTPTIAILLVDNAKDDTLGWSEIGFVDYVGWYDDKKLLINISESLKKLDSIIVRKKMCNSAMNYINFDAGELLVEKILGKLNDTF